jgi:hypothetical protein
MEKIKQGSMIKGPYWPEPVEIKLFEEANSPGNSSAKISL